VRRAMRPNPEDRWLGAAEMRAGLLTFAPMNRASALPAMSRLPTGASTPFVPVSRTPRVDAATWEAATVQGGERASNVPRTLPPFAGPPLATTQTPVKAKTASMPEVGRVAATPGSPATALPPHIEQRSVPGARLKRKRRAWPWLVFLTLLAGTSAFAWYAYDELLDVGPTPPPQPTRRIQTPAPIPGAPEENNEEFEDFDTSSDRSPAERPDPPRAPRPATPPNPLPSNPLATLPTFQLPTNLPLPTALPTVFPTSFPFPSPFPTAN
jgi:hypothetical protein